MHYRFSPPGFYFDWHILLKVFRERELLVFLHFFFLKMWIMSLCIFQQVSYFRNGSTKLLKMNTNGYPSCGTLFPFLRFIYKTWCEVCHAIYLRYVVVGHLNWVNKVIHLIHPLGHNLGTGYCDRKKEKNLLTRTAQGENFREKFSIKI